MEETALVPMGGAAGELVMRSPDTVIAEAKAVATALRRQADELGLYKQIGDSKHLLIEGWLLVGHMFRVTPRVRETNFLDFGSVRGFEAVAEAVHVPSGSVVGQASAMCLNDEDRWDVRPKYDYVNGKRTLVGTTPVPLQQIRSMAQTRACSKVMSTVFKHIAKMGGFAGTPAEEMRGDEKAGGGINQPQRKAEGEAQPPSSGTGKVISEPQRKRLFGIGHSAQKSTEQVVAIIKSFGFDRAEHVTTDKYEAVCAAIQAPVSDTLPGMTGETKTYSD